jgi:hypothetical protein
VPSGDIIQSSKLRRGLGRNIQASSGGSTQNLYRVFVQEIKSISVINPVIIPSSSDWNIASGEYSISCHFFLNNVAGSDNLYHSVFWIGEPNYSGVYLNLSQLRSGLGNSLYLDFQSATQRSAVDSGTFFTPSTYFVRISPSYSAVNKWTHYVCTVSYLNSEIRVYINGNFAGVVPITGAWNATNTLHIGRANTSDPIIFSGKIPILRMYKGVVLTPSEIAQMYDDDVEYLGI